MKEILKDIYTWSWYSQEKGMDFNGFLIKSEGGNVMIDSTEMTPSDEEEIDKIGAPKYIIITNRDHEREAAHLKLKYDAQVYINELDAPLMEEVEADKTFKDKAKLPGGLVVIHVQDNKSPGESALLLEREEPVLILGDALIGKPQGQLNLLPPEKYKDIEKAKEGIKVLLEYEYGSVLAADGASILEDGKVAIRDFIRRNQ